MPAGFTGSRGARGRAGLGGAFPGLGARPFLPPSPAPLPALPAPRNATLLGLPGSGDPFLPRAGGFLAEPRHLGGGLLLDLLAKPLHASRFGDARNHGLKVDRSHGHRPHPLPGG